MNRSDHGRAAHQVDEADEPEAPVPAQPSMVDGAWQGTIGVRNVTDREALMGPIAAMQPATGPLEVMKSTIDLKFELEQHSIKDFADGGWFTGMRRPGSPCS